MLSFQTTRFAIEFAATHQPAGKPALRPKDRETAGRHQFQDLSIHGRYFSPHPTNSASGSEPLRRTARIVSEADPFRLGPGSPSPV